MADLVVDAEGERGGARVAPPVDLSPGTIAVLLASVVGLALTTSLVRSVPRTATAIGIATLLALALNPLVALVQRRLGVRRGLAVATVLAGLFAALALVITLLVPPAVRQARNLSSDLPSVVQDLGELPVVGRRLVEADVPAKLDKAVRELPARLTGDASPLTRAGRSLVEAAVLAFATLLLATTLLVDGERLVRSLRRLVPAGRRSQADRLARTAYEVVGRYVAGSVSVAVLAGVVNLITGLVLGVPLALLAAVNVALWNLVPQIGGLFGAVPFILLGLSKGPGTGAACGLVFLVYMNTENHLIQPLLIGNAVKLSPPVTMVAALIGVAAGGVVGALLVIPVVGAVKAVYLELRRPPPTPGREGSLPAGAEPEAA
jgi:predicted PurR-regulated permease PerM